MSAPDTMKATLLDAKTEAAALRIRVRQLEEKLVDAAAVSEREADALRQGADVLVTENARLVAANTRQAEEATAAQCAANEALFTARSRGESLANAIAANTRLREECDALRSLLSRVERLTGVGPPSRPGKPTPGSTWYDLLVQVNALVRGSRERAISPESQPDPAPAVTGTPSDNPSICKLPAETEKRLEDAVRLIELAHPFVAEGDPKMLVDEVSQPELLDRIRLFVIGTAGATLHVPMPASGPEQGRACQEPCDVCDGEPGVEERARG